MSILHEGNEKLKEESYMYTKREKSMKSNDILLKIIHIHAIDLFKNLVYSAIIEPLFADFLRKA
jgi:hypothetical protein